MTIETPPPPVDASFMLGQHEARLAEIEEKLGIHAGAIGEVHQEAEQAQETADAAARMAVDAMVATPAPVDMQEVREEAASVAEAVAEVVAEEVATEVAVEVAEEVPAATPDGEVTEVAEETPPPAPEAEGDKPLVEDDPAPRRRPRPYGRRGK